MAEFLVELYVSRADAGGVERAEQRARQAAAALSAEGRPVRFVRSIFVPEDETCFLVVEADTVATVREAAIRAPVTFERVLATAARPTTRAEIPYDGDPTARNPNSNGGTTT